MTKARTLADNFAADINGITAGTGITGGGTSGTVTVTNEMATIIDAKGDLVGGTGADTFARLAVGTDGQVLTADSNETTGLKWAASGAAFAGVAVYRTATQSLSNGVGTIINWTAEYYDTDAYHDNSTNNTRLTVPAGKGGKYLVTATGVFNANALGVRDIAIRKNGTTYLGSFSASITSADTNQTTCVTRILDLAVSDYLEIDAIQTSGGSLTFLSGDNGSYFAMYYLGA
jgi:hypothetical protein